MSFCLFFSVIHLKKSFSVPFILMRVPYFLFLLLATMMKGFPFSLSAFLLIVTVPVFFGDVRGTFETVFGPISVNYTFLCLVVFHVCFAYHFFLFLLFFFVGKGFWVLISSFVLRTLSSSVVYVLLWL